MNITLDQYKGTPIEKSFNNDIEKGKGEGSRGGHVVGHSKKSGKAIYDNKKSSFSPENMTTQEIKRQIEFDSNHLESSRGKMHYLDVLELEKDISYFTKELEKRGDKNVIQEIPQSQTTKNKPTPAPPKQEGKKISVQYLRDLLKNGIPNKANRDLYQSFIKQAGDSKFIELTDKQHELYKVAKGTRIGIHQTQFCTKN